jgi:hypothetical protein
MGDSFREFVNDFFGTKEDQPEPSDGGLPPGGVPDTPCGWGPCPQCAGSRKQSSGCVLQAGHDGAHQCAHGDQFIDAAAERCGERCPQEVLAWCIKDQGHTVGPHWCGQHEW